MNHGEPGLILCLYVFTFLPDKTLGASMLQITYVTSEMSGLKKASLDSFHIIPLYLPVFDLRASSSCIFRAHDSTLPGASVAVVAVAAKTDGGIRRHPVPIQSLQYRRTGIDFGIGNGNVV